MSANDHNDPFHAGEIAVQERAGVRTGATKIGRSIDDEIVPAAAHFLVQRYTLYLGTLDAALRPWASQLFGPPGFIGAVDPHTVRIDATPAPGDPLLENLRADPRVGLLDRPRHPARFR
jgi:predicted pyridoxine 5'-phosphate oxidase superfamily flavin-nucleotide-binding protein